MLNNSLKNAKKRYGYIVKEAMRRNIDYQITFDDWYQWWLANGVDKNQITLPPTTGQTLCMCRKGDTGPYHLNNIYCDTLSNNNRHSWLNNSQRNKRKLTTPLGTFESVRAAAKAHAITAQSMQYYIKRYPIDYYYI